jgi:hypothetical protein
MKPIVWAVAMEMKYPTREEIAAATRYQLCVWHRFLRSPETLEEVELNRLMFKRWNEAGGFTPEISKAIGWDWRERAHVITLII